MHSIWTVNTLCSTKLLSNILKANQCVGVSIQHLLLSVGVEVNFFLFLHRYRGFARDGGFDGEGENRESVTILGRTYWQVLCARLAFVVLFEVSIQFI